MDIGYILCHQALQIFYASYSEETNSETDDSECYN